MNLQQLKYIVALNRFRNFARAAEACLVSQPTLSAMLVKLEEELDTRIFERNNKTVSPTASGKKIIRQAETALQEIDRISEIVMEEKGEIGGKLSLAVGPTIAPYILPKFIRHYRENYPSVDLNILELKADFMLDSLLRGETDAGIAISEKAVKAYWRFRSTRRSSMCILPRAAGASSQFSSQRILSMRTCGL